MDSPHSEEETKRLVEATRVNGMITSAYNCTACCGCKYAGEHTGGWCHQYVEHPKRLPCKKFSLPV